MKTKSQKHPVITCPVCAGRGEMFSESVRWSVEADDVCIETNYWDCPNCNGTGAIILEDTPLEAIPLEIIPVGDMPDWAAA